MSHKIAVAGGSEAWRRGMASMLEECGYETAFFEALDVWQPGIGGSAVVALVEGRGDEGKIQAHVDLHEDIPVVAVVDDPSVGRVARLMRAGAAAVVDEHDDARGFQSVVGEALDGRVSLPYRFARAMAETTPDSDDFEGWLTDDEAGWLQAMAEGQTVSDLAAHNGYSERAMFRLLRSLYTRIGVRNRTEALIWASRSGLLTPEVDKE
ncbi:MAG: hypothetical protein R3258_00360 [Acidimicrobiia bacterium]|nr:hypothetical protein [Acidimicrobiia bacterium]